MLVKMSKDQRHASMKTGLCRILVATQCLGGWLAVAQTNTCPLTSGRSSANQANAGRAASVSTGRTNPAIAVSPRSLDFGSVLVGRASTLSFTVQNLGGSILTGAARVSAPFSVVGGSPYVLRSSQSQVITVQYVPKATGMNMTVVSLTGGGGASLTVAGSGARVRVPVRPAAPAPPQNLRFIARAWR